ncbi:substrate-binding domain-containing protein [Metabacillus idriensis]|uniref:PstS family phosphate ABC transporter substrate-binding protein n=1 Tax=Metabacillus idriensis TaxID=324768 RepID=UPI003D27E845
MFFKWFLYFGLVPFVLSILSVVLLSAVINSIFIASLIVFIAGGFAAGCLKSKKPNENDLLIVSLPLAYTALLWAVYMLVSGGFTGDGAWLYYGIFHMAYAPVFFFSSFEGEGRTFLWAPLAFEMAILVPVLISLLVNKRVSAFSLKKGIAILSIIIIGIGTGAAVQMNRNKTVLPSYGFEYGGGFSSTDLSPYDVTNPGNKLPKLKNGSEFTIQNSSEMPVLDGAEAAFPVYSAFAEATYKNVRSVVSTEKEVVSFTNTIYAYERLLSGEVDLYFGAEPSKEQRLMAEEAGKELVMTPIGKEAFVFFVNPGNKVESLSVSDIQSIYSGEINNWSQLGGKVEKIVAFQRPKNSGSQTLLEKIMGNTQIEKPLKEEVPQGMGGIIEQVADYRNYENAIGFSFRFFATGMKENQDIKLLAIDGVKPDPENISSGEYPFTANLYAISLKSNPNKNIDPFLDWMRGHQGQQIVEEIGYIRYE